MMMIMIMTTMMIIIIIIVVCRTGDNSSSNSDSNWNGVENPAQKFQTSKATTRHLLKHSKGSKAMSEQTGQTTIKHRYVYTVRLFCRLTSMWPKVKVKLALWGFFNTAAVRPIVFLPPTSSRIHLQRRHASYRCARPLPAKAGTITNEFC